MEIDQILKCVDHTLLKQTAVFADVKKLLDEAERFHTASACISPTMLARAKAYKGNAVRLSRERKCSRAIYHSMQGEP